MGQDEWGEPDLTGVIGNEIKARGLTIRAAADAMAPHMPDGSMSPSTLDRRLRRVTPFTSPELYAIATVFGTTLSGLAAMAEDAA